MMRQSLKDLIDKTIAFSYSLPNKDLNIEKTKHSTREDDCYRSVNDSDFADVIYNSIIDYSYSEYDLGVKDYSALLTRALRSKLKYDETADSTKKISYGFYGEVLLHVMLRLFYKTEVLISRGYFYSPLENSETKGYDCYHLVENGSNVDLWFGEVKFRQSFDSCVNSVFDSIEKTLSDEYLKGNIIALDNHSEKLEEVSTSNVKQILERWRDNPEIKLIDEIKKENMRLIYPVFLVSKKYAGGYDKTVDAVVKLIDAKTINIALSIPYTIFFVIIPVDDVKKIKEEVIQCITEKKSLLL